jgi:hypothetical protein
MTPDRRGNHFCGGQRSNCAQLSSGIPRTLMFERESEAAWARSSRQEMRQESWDQKDFSSSRRLPYSL